MFGTFITSLIIAVLAGGVAFYSWRQNSMVALASAAVCLIASVIAVITGLASTVAIVFKLLPWLLLALGIWLVYRVLTSRNSDAGAQADAPAQRPVR